MKQLSGIGDPKRKEVIRNFRENLFLNKRSINRNTVFRVSWLDWPGPGCQETIDWSSENNPLVYVSVLTCELKLRE